MEGIVRISRKYRTDCLEKVETSLIEEKTVIQPGETIDEAMLELISPVAEKQRRAMKILIRHAKRGKSWDFWDPELNFLRNFIWYFSQDGLTDFKPVLKLLLWITKCSKSIDIVIHSSETISMLRERLNESNLECQCLCYRIWANLLKKDENLFKDLLSHKCFEQVFTMYDLHYPEIDTDDDSVTVVTSILSLVPALILRASLVEDPQKHLIQKAVTMISQCLCDSYDVVCLAAAKALDQATDVTDETSLMMFYDRSLFFKYLELCRHEDKDIAFHMLSVILHFVCLQPEYIAELVIPLITSLGYDLDSVHHGLLLVLLLIIYHLVIKDVDICRTIVTSDMMRVLYDYHGKMTFNCKEVYLAIISEMAQWRQRDFVEFAVFYFSDAVYLMIEALESDNLDKTNKQIVLRGLLALAEYTTMTSDPGSLVDAMYDEALDDALRGIYDDGSNEYAAHLANMIHSTLYVRQTAP